MQRGLETYRVNVNKMRRQRFNFSVQMVILSKKHYFKIFVVRIFFLLALHQNSARRNTWSIIAIVVLQRIMKEVALPHTRVHFCDRRECIWVESIFLTKFGAECTSRAQIAMQRDSPFLGFRRADDLWASYAKFYRCCWRGRLSAMCCLPRPLKGCICMVILRCSSSEIYLLFST